VLKTLELKGVSKREAGSPDLLVFQTDYDETNFEKSVMTSFQ